MITVLFLSTQLATPSPATLVYKSSFKFEDALNDWVMEGPGVATIDNGRLLVHSKWQPLKDGMTTMKSTSCTKTRLSIQKRIGEPLPLGAVPKHEK
ncbi:MAG: hypothetical protein O3C43_17335 [Verrucomicrobia bacterium]|nr:hypothetical protein [Verrucomicrobiota bacterium]